MPTNTSPWSHGLPAGVCQGRQACRGLLADLLIRLSMPAQPPGQASQAPAGLPRWMLWADVDFSAWPLDEPRVLASLADWLRPAGRQLSLLGTDFDALSRVQPRFVRWRRNWAHRIEAWRPVEIPLPANLRGLWAESVALQWLDAPGWRLRPITDEVHLQAMHTQCADYLQRCEPTWPSTTLGL